MVWHILSIIIEGHKSEGVKGIKTFSKNWELFEEN